MEPTGLGEAHAGPARAPVSARRVMICSTLSSTLMLAGMWFMWPRENALSRFWEPVLRSRQPVLLCVPEERPHGAMARFFERRGKPMRVRTGGNTSMADLRNSPAVLIGAHSNQPAMQAGDDLRYVFDWDGRNSVIRDRLDRNQSWAAGTANPPSDYAVISRLFDTRTGEVLITAAGTGRFGTHAAEEFLTSAACMEQAVRGAPPAWYAQNMQVVLRAEVIGKTPGPPTVVASWFW